MDATVGLVRDAELALQLAQLGIRGSRYLRPEYGPGCIAQGHEAAQLRRVGAVSGLVGADLTVLQAADPTLGP